MNKPEDNPRKCKKFNSCSRNFCPLDLDLNLRSGKKQDKCRFMREPRISKIQRREFVSGGTAMPDVLLNFVPSGNVERLNNHSRYRWEKLKTTN